MRVLVLGAGMYVTGRQGSGPGTILSSLAETSRSLPISEVTVAAPNPGNEEVVAEAIARINATIGTGLKAGFRRLGGDASAALTALCSETRYDCAIVSTPDHLHFGHASAILEQGLHCLVVKPLTPTLEQSRQLVRLQEARGLYGAVEFHKRFDETNLYIKKALAEGKLGKLLYFTVDYSQKISIPTITFAAWSSKTNIFQYLGVHYVDLIHFLTGFLPVRAMAVGTEGVLAQRGLSTFDSVHACVLWKNPADESDRFVSQFATNWIDPVCTSAMSDQKYKVVGTRGRIECDQKNRGVELVQEELGIQHVNPYFSDYLPDENGNLRYGGYGHTSINLFLQDVAALQQGTTTVAVLEKSRPTFRRSLVATAVVDAVNDSLSHQARWVDVDDAF